MRRVRGLEPQLYLALPTTAFTTSFITTYNHRTPELNRYTRYHLLEDTHVTSFVTFLRLCIEPLNSSNV